MRARGWGRQAFCRIWRGARSWRRPRRFRSCHGGSRCRSDPLTHVNGSIGLLTRSGWTSDEDDVAPATMGTAENSAARSPADAELRRLAECREHGVRWRKWGPYLSERQWGTVREDYSNDGNAWKYFTHDQA